MQMRIGYMETECHHQAPMAELKDGGESLVGHDSNEFGFSSINAFDTKTGAAYSIALLIRIASVFTTFLFLLAVSESTTKLIRD